ncbi:MAG: PAS domain S-box protein [Gemmatimonadaceae bacterium]|nr:PAS domain S-box protein [Gemmatimonadaceae bacterium]
MSLRSAQLARRAEKPLYRHVATATGALALAGGIWTMHFIGMLAYVVPAEVHYDLSLTLASFLPACAASWPAMRILARPKVSFGALLGAGLLVGLGIGTMHYAGMTAMDMSLAMTYDPFTFGLSIVVAAVLAVLALWIRYGLRGTALTPRQRFGVSGVVMGLAIAGMHYTGMAALRISGTPVTPAHSFPITSEVASVSLALVAVLVTLLVFATNDLIRSRELYRRLEEGESRLRATLDTTVDAIVTIDSHGRVQSVNHSVERIFLWKPEELIGQHISVLMPVEAQERQTMRPSDDFVPSANRMVGVEREVLGVKKDGTEVPLRLSVGRVELSGEVMFVSFLTDISERRALEVSLRETADRAERAAAAKSTFLANMSHEIRTPMNSIIGFTELLLQGELSATQRAHLRTVRQSSRALLALINDILDTTRLEKEGLVLEVIDFSLKALAMQIESSLRLGAQNKGLMLTTHYPAELPEHFSGDPLRLLQVLTNLVGNAIKFTERGGVDVYFAQEGEHVAIRVQDTGIGMSAEQLASIFAPFTQADASISRRFGGTGLGTTIARQLVELMHGTIEVTSTVGQGSCFTVRLPLAPGQAGESARAVPQAPSIPALKILAADDVPQNLELLHELMVRDGHTLVSARDGAEAVRLFMAGSFDLVMLDMHMPGTDGLEAARLIRRHEREVGVRTTPILALTASVLPEDRRAAHHAGMDGFAVKPIDMAALRSEMSRVLRGRTEEEAVVEHGAPINPATVVHWESALRLWGTRERVVRAISAFSSSIPEQYPVLSAIDGSVDRHLLLSALHAVRGAAGNLGLLQVAQIASDLENQWRALPPGVSGPAINALRDALHAVELQVEQDGEDKPPTRRVAQSFTGEFLLGAAMSSGEHEVPPAMTAAAVQDAIARLRTTLQRSEFDDATLDLVCRHAEGTPLTPIAIRLRSAVESFEFARAERELDAYIRALQGPSEQVA